MGIPLVDYPVVANDKNVVANSLLDMHPPLHVLRTTDF